eukprot:946599-Amphidinium_carterae.1
MSAEEVLQEKPDYPTQAALRGLCFEMFAIIAAELQVPTGSTSEKVGRKKTPTGEVGWVDHPWQLGALGLTCRLVCGHA